MSIAQGADYRPLTTGLPKKDSEQYAVGSNCGTTDYRTRKKEKITRVLREPQDPEGNRGAKAPFDGLRVVRELEPQDPEGNRGAKTQRAPSSAKIY